jgi:DNA-binding transcriptional LysR family regulator
MRPNVSEVIADLEQALDARLFDRRPRGVEPTMYGKALFKRTRAVFDELRQGVRDIKR